MILAAAFCGGLFTGLSMQQDLLDKRCRTAGGEVGPIGICEGVPARDG
ncbi:MAG: hypothetical protein ACK5JR_17055 [Tropicimonas sp.]